MRVFNSLVVVLFLSVVSDTSAATSSVAEDELRLMISASTPSRLSLTLEGVRVRRRARGVCEVQLRSRRLPIACFRAVEISGGHQEMNWLDKLCLDRVRDSRDRRELIEVGGDRLVPSDCRKAAIKRADDLEYAEQVSRPAELFSRTIDGR